MSTFWYCSGNKTCKIRWS